MKHFFRWLLVGGGLLLAICYAVFVNQQGEVPKSPAGAIIQDTPDVEFVGGVGEPESLAPVPGNSPGEAVSVQEPLSELPASQTRVPVAQAAFSGVLVNETGQSVPNARLSWTSYPSDLLAASSEIELGHWMIDQEQYEQTTVWTNSNPKGAFAFPAPPASAESDLSVIWATHLDYLAAPILLGEDATTWPLGTRVVMEASSTTRVRVMDGKGTGVQGASVYAYAVVREPKSFLVPLEPEELVRLCLRRSAETGPGGRVDVPTFRGETVLRAQHEEEISEEWMGEGGGVVELLLVPSFTVGGQLTLTEDVELYPRDLTVSIDGWRDGLSRRICRVLFDEGSLTWGPVQIPLHGESQFSFHLRAKRIEPRTRHVPSPGPGQNLTVDFESKRGNEVWFSLEDRELNLLSEGLVELSWDGHPEYGTLSLKLREDGYAPFYACPTGRISTIRGTSPGYAPGTVVGFLVPEAEIVVNPIILSRGGKIVGKCMADGKPVNDFEVVLWPTEDYAQTSRHRFEGAEDGAFVLENAPMGQLQLVAFSQGHAPSIPEPVHVVSGEQAEVELLLQSQHSVKGHVVDEAGAPLSSATIQLYTENDRYLIAEWGPPIDVDSSGRFALEGLPPGRTGLRVTAPGYSSSKQWLEVVTGAPQEQRTFRLAPLRDLEVRFHFADGVDAARYSVCIGSDPRNVSPRKGLLDSGTARFPMVSVATDSLWLQFMGENVAAMRLPKPTGRDWIAEYEFGGKGRLVIDVDLGSKADELPVSMMVRLDSYAYGDKALVQYALLPETGEVSFEAIQPGRYLAKVTAGWLQAYGTTLITVADGETTHATIVLDSADTVFQVVDRRGDPVAGVSLSIYDTDYPLWRQAVTDSEGLCTVSGAPAMGAYVGLQHSLLGDLWGIPVQLAQGVDEVIELEFVAENTVALHLLDGDVPVAGVTGRLNASDNRNVEVSFSRESAADGRLKFERLGEALYGVDLRGANTWEKKIEVRATETGETTVQVRRVGNLRFEVSGFNGASPAGIPIELTSLEFKTSAEAWISEGKLLTIPVSTRTDDNGALLFPQIPHGAYRWRLAGPGGKLHEGEIDVLVGGEAVVKVGVE